MDAADLRRVRAEVGSSPDTPTVEALFDAFDGSWVRTALQIVKERLANFEAKAASLSAEGLSLGTSANITALTKKVERLELLAAMETVDADGDGRPDGSAAVGRLVRADRR